MSKPKQLVHIEWSPEFAYAIGLLVTDGSLSKSGRHINFTSKDKALVRTLRACLRTNQNITKKTRGGQTMKKYYQVQIGDVVFYRFLESIGLSQNKTHTIGTVDVPNHLFFDFLRGHFDGDGTFYSYYDPRWKSSFMYYMTFISASKKHLLWLRGRINDLADVKGHLCSPAKSRVSQLRFAKRETEILVKKMYHSPRVPCLGRKHLKIQRALSILTGP